MFVTAIYLNKPEAAPAILFNIMYVFSVILSPSAYFDQIKLGQDESVTKPAFWLLAHFTPQPPLTQ